MASTAFTALNYDNNVSSFTFPQRSQSTHLPTSSSPPMSPSARPTPSRSSSFGKARSRFSDIEDAIICEGVARGLTWGQISSQLPHRKRATCFNRYRTLQGIRKSRKKIGKHSMTMNGSSLITPPSSRRASVVSCCSSSTTQYDPYSSFPSPPLNIIPSSPWSPAASPPASSFCNHLSHNDYFSSHPARDIYQQYNNAVDNSYTFPDPHHQQHYPY